MSFDKKFSFNLEGVEKKTLQIMRSGGTHYLFKIEDALKVELEEYQRHTKQIPITASQAIEIANLILEEEANRVLLEE